MKTTKTKQFMVKLLAFCLAIVIAFPANVLAASLGETTTNYDESSSLMGDSKLTNDGIDKAQIDSNNNSSLLKSDKALDETTDYIIEKSASLSKTTGQIDYKISIKSKAPSTDDLDKSKEKLIASFATNANTDLKDLKLEQVTSLDEDGKEIETTFKEDNPNGFFGTDSELSSLAISLDKPAYGVVYYLSAKVDQDSLANLDKESPILALDMVFLDDKEKAIYENRYSLKTNTEVTIDQEDSVSDSNLATLVKDDSDSIIRGAYKAEEKKLIGTTPASITWTDYILSTDDKEFTYNLDLDDSQDTTDAKIKIDFYEAKDNGFVLNKDFSQNIDFAKSINLAIPQGQLARIELTTKPSQKKNPKTFTYNGVSLNNPSYKEEKTESNPTESDEEDPDPLSLKEDKKAANKDSLKTDQSSKENAKSPSSIDSITDESDQDLSKNSKTEPTKEKSSAIALNKDAYLDNLKADDKLTENLEKVTNQIELVLESYNKEEINWDDFVASVQNIAKSQNIEASQTKEILSSLIVGLNEGKYKVANIDIDQAAGFDAEETADQAKTEEGKELSDKTPDELAKDKLAEEGITIADFQSYMYELEEKYNLTDEDAARIYGDNAEAIQSLAEKAQEEKTTGDIFAVQEKGSYQTAYPYSIEYDVETSVRDGDGKPISAAIPSAGQNPEVWWDITLDTSKVKDPNLNYDNLYYTLYMGAKDGLDRFKYKVSTRSIAEDDTRGFDTASERSDFLYQGYDNIRKKDLGDKLYIRVKATIDDDSEVHDQYSLGIRINPDKNYINNILNEFLAKYEAIPTPLKWKVGDGKADIYRDRPYNLLDERIVASPNFIKYDIDDNFYFDSTRSITADRRSDTRVEWNVLDLLRFGESEDPNIEKASLNPNIDNSDREKYYYRPNLTGGYNRYSNERDVKTKNGEFYPGTIVAYNFEDQKGSPHTNYKLDVVLKDKENLFKDQLNNQMNGVEKLTDSVGGNVSAYTYKIPPAAIDDQYLAYNENPFAIMRINQTFEMVQCFNDGYSDPTSSGNDIIGLQRIEDPEAAFLWSMMEGNNYLEAQKNLRYGGDFYQAGKSEQEALKDALERAYYYTNQVVEEKEKQDGKKIPRQVEAFLYQKMVHLITNKKPLDQQYGGYTSISNQVKNWTKKNTTLTGNEADKYFTGVESKENRTIPADERRIQNNDKEALDGAKELAEKAKTLLEDSYTNGDWDKTKADSVELVFYKHNNKKTIQHLITAKIRKPINARKINVDGTKLAGAEFTFTSRQTGESVTWTSKENNEDNPLFLKPGQYYVDETKAPKGHSELETFLIELEEVEIKPDDGRYPQHGLDIHVNDGYEYKLSILDPSTREKNPDAVQKDGSGESLVSIEDNTLNLNIKNESKLGEIEFTKVNKSGRELDGATFTLTKIKSEENQTVENNSDGKPVYQKTSTGDNGHFTFASIAEGTYKLEETAAPTGYQKIDPLILIATKGENDEVTVKFKDEEIESSKQIINQAPSTDLNFRKIKEKEEGEEIVPIDSGTGKFRLYATSTSDGSDYDRTVSPTATFIPADDDTQALEVGEFRFTDIVPGAYILVEEQAPVGFQKPDNPFWRVKVMEDENNSGQLTYEVYRLSDDEPIEPEKILRGENEEEGTTVNIENAPRTTKLEFRKYDSRYNQITGDKLVGKDGKSVEFMLHEADHYGNKKDPGSESRSITADDNGVFSIDGLEYSAYYLLEEVNPPAGYTKAEDTVLYVAAEAEVTVGEIKVIVRDLTANTITEKGKLLTGIIDYEEGERRGEFTIKKTGQSLIEDDDRKVGLRRAYFRLYHADKDFNYANKEFNPVDKDKSYYYQRVTSGIALTDEDNQPLEKSELPEDQGLATFENLKAGNYILEEYRGPAGYEKDPIPRYVTVDGQGKVTITKKGEKNPEDLNDKSQYEIFNKDETGFRIPLRITKKDESGSPLSGAKFRAVKIIKGQDPNVQYYDEEFDAISAATGLAGDNYIRELTPGIYELTEYQTPRPEFEKESDYLEPLDKNGEPLKWYFEVKRNPDVTDPRAANYMIIDFAFSHTFKETDKFTDAGQDYKDKWIGKTIYGTEPVNGEDGKVANEDFMKLIKLVPDDGRLNPARPDAPYKGINDLEVTNVKKTTDFDFIKADDYSRAIEGAEFKLKKLATDKDGNIQKTPISGEYNFEKDEDGNEVYDKSVESNLDQGVRFTDIPAGKYLLEETKAPAGYEKLEKPIIVEFKISPATGRWEQRTVIDEDNGIDSEYYNNIISYKSDNTGISQIKNKKAYTKLEFTKVDQSDNEVNASAFTLEKLDENGNVDKSFTLQERRNWNNPKFTFENLTKGEYKLTETNPTRFQRPNPTYFKVDEEVVEDEETGKLEIKLEEGDPNIKFVEKDDIKEVQFTNFDKIDFEFKKVGDKDNPLYGAGFTLKKVLTEKPRQVGSGKESKEIDRSKQIKYTESGMVAEESKELSDHSYYEKARSYSDGKIKFTGLSQGVYELEETDIPNGYQRLNAQRKWIVIVEKNKAGDSLEVKYDKEYEESYYEGNNSYKADDTNTLTIGEKENTLKNTSNTTDLNFEKVDRNGNGNVIAKDTKFSLIKLSHDPNDLDNLSEIKTYIDYINLREDDGTFNVRGLDRGIYVLSETQAPEGYKLADRDIVLKIVEENESSENLVIKSYERDDKGNLIESDFKYLNNSKETLQIANDEIPNITFNKVTNGIFTNNKNIENGTLKISISKYDEATKQASEVETLTFDLAKTKSTNKIYIEDADGNKELEDGEHLIKETKAPQGYANTDRSYLVEITTKDGVVSAKLLEVRDASGKSIRNKTGELITDTGIEISDGGLPITVGENGKSNFQIVNNNPSLPSTGGAGTKIAFAIIGTAVMLAAIAYFAIYQNDKNRPRSNRFGK